MNNTNPYRNSQEKQPLSERDVIEGLRVRLVNGTNKIRLALYRYDPTVSVPTAQISQFKPKTTPVPTPETVTPPSSGALDNVVDMMGWTNNQEADPEFQLKFHSYEPEMAVAETRDTIPESLTNVVNMADWAQNREESNKLSDQQTREAAANEAIDRAFKEAA